MSAKPEAAEGGQAKGGKRKLLLLAAVPVVLAAIGAGLWFSGLLPKLLGKGQAAHAGSIPGPPDAKRTPGLFVGERLREAIRSREALVAHDGRYSRGAAQLHTVPRISCQKEVKHQGQRDLYGLRLNRAECSMKSERSEQEKVRMPRCRSADGAFPAVLQ